MKKDATIFLKHVLESMEKIEEYIKGISKENFLKDTKLQDSVIRRLEIIGEAVKNLPKDVTEGHPDVSWRDIAGMRDKVIHRYFGVDLNITWQVVKIDIPDLKEKITRILAEVEENE